MDVFAYATFTSPNPNAITVKMSGFMDRLQEIDEALPLRVVPLEIEVWGPVGPRMRDLHERSLIIQQEAIEAWTAELGERFSTLELACPISQVRLTRARRM